MSAPPPLLFLCLVSIYPFLHLARSDDTSDQLLQGLNSYRASLNLSSLAENDNAACLADQLAKKFKDQPCSNTTGSDTVPGTEQQFSDFPDLLNHCHLDVTVTQDGELMPACVPNLDAGLVLSNFTMSQYSQYLNDSRFVGTGIADEGDWVVVVLSTNTPTGNFATVAGAAAIIKAVLKYHFLLWLLSYLINK